MKKVLIVNRDPAVRTLVAATIDATRYLAFEAGAVSAGHEKVSECRPDVVILESELLSDWYRESVPADTIDPDRIERTPVLLLDDAQSIRRAPESVLPGSASAKVPFSPLELARRLEMVAGESCEA